MHPNNFGYRLVSQKCLSARLGLGVLLWILRKLTPTLSYSGCCECKGPWNSCPYWIPLVALPMFYGSVTVCVHALSFIFCYSVHLFVVNLLVLCHIYFSFIKVLYICIYIYAYAHAYAYTYTYIYGVWKFKICVLSIDRKNVFLRASDALIKSCFSAGCSDTRL